MIKSLVITRPNHDLTTNYLYFWSEKILHQAVKSNVNVIDLKGRRANKKELTGVISKIKPPFVIFNGHGNKDSIGGIDNQILVQIKDNEEILRKTIVYAISCQSAKRLGPSCVKKGTRAYIGYTDDFIFICDENLVFRPLEDKTAKLFLEPSNQVAISLLKNNSAENSCKRSQEQFRNNIRRILTSESSPEDKEVLPYLFWDMNHQKCIGDGKVSI